MHDGMEEALVLRAADAPPGVRVLAVAADRYFDRPYLYGEPIGDYADNARRFAFFCRAALAAVDALGLAPDVLHCHDWQTALVPAYLRGGIVEGDGAARAREHLGSAAVVLTLHNVGYQGTFPASDFAATGLPRALFSVDGVEFHGRVNLLKGGIRFADHVTTVSPGYAREIRLAEQGAGLEGVLATRAGDLTGILNGIDERIWDPAGDRLIVANFDADRLDAKAANKTALLNELGLPRRDGPLLGVVSRLSAQKGLDLVLEALPSIMELGGQLVVLGSGERNIEMAFRDAVGAYPDRLAVRLAYDETMSHRIQAGADLLLVPSRFEPCGLTQLYALRYGTLPVVRRTGGLADTVVDVGAFPDEGTGFLFTEPRPGALMSAIRRAFDLYGNREKWRNVQRQAMKQDFGWRASAGRYQELYRELVDKRAMASSG
jgi:starch synthase